MFETLIVQPIVNMLVVIYAVLPGHNFGLSIILFTILVRLAMHPLIKKQLHHSKAMKELQPEIEKIKKATKGNSQETSRLITELYKEREISPFSSLGTLIVQVLVLIGLYTGLREIADDSSVILTNTYEWVRSLGTIQELAIDISKFDFSLFSFVDLTRPVQSASGFYLPGFILVLGATISQYFMGKQTLPEEEDARSLRAILKQSKTGHPTFKQGEIQSLFARSLKYLIPLFIFFFTYSLPSALALYWFVSGVVGYIQQKRILDQDKEELLATKKSKKD